MIFAYNLGIRVYYLLVLLVSPINQKAKRWINGRKGSLKELSSKIDPASKNVWFHASSLGEFEQGRPIIEALKKEYPEIKIVLTFFSPSGYEIRKNYTGADYICYLPLDTRRNARKFVRIVNPTWVFFIKYEYWYHFLKQVKRNNSKLFLVSGIFRQDQLFFKKYGIWYRKMLKFFDHLFIQNGESGRLLDTIGIKNFTISGDSRFDRVIQIANQSKEIEAVKLFSDGFKVIVCGSTWEPDEEILINYLQTTSTNIKLIIAPHEIQKSNIESITEKLKLPYMLFSQVNNHELLSARVLIIDNIGMLASLYKYGQIAYIGGGFGAGIHNTLEAAVYGLPVIFGPNYQKFQEANDLIAVQGGFSISGFEDFKAIVDDLLDNPEKLKNSGDAAGNYVKKMKGATSILLNYLRNN